LQSIGKAGWLEGLTGGEWYASGLDTGARFSAHVIHHKLRFSSIHFNIFSTAESPIDSPWFTKGRAILCRALKALPFANASIQAKFSTEDDKEHPAK